MGSLLKQLQKVWEVDPAVSSGSVLRQLWDLLRHLGKVHYRCYKALSTLKFHIELLERDGSKALWTCKEDSKRFQVVARKDNSLSSPFQYHCWFTNLTKHVAIRNSSPETRPLGYIRRVNLDVMWSQEACFYGLEIP